MAGRSMSDEHVSGGLQEEEASQPNYHQSGEVDIPLAVDQTLHGHHVLLARFCKEARMGMPFTEIIEAPEIRSRLSKKGFESFGMMSRAADKMRSRSGRSVD